MCIYNVTLERLWWRGSEKKRVQMFPKHATVIKIGTFTLPVNNALNISHNILLIALFHFQNWIAFFIIQSTRKRFIKFYPPHYGVIRNFPESFSSNAMQSAHRRERISLNVQRNCKEIWKNCFTIHYEFFIIRFLGVAIGGNLLVMRR